MQILAMLTCLAAILSLGLMVLNFLKNTETKN